jgi:WD40 repeat protein
MKRDEAVGMLASRLAVPPRDSAPLRSLARRLGDWPLLLRLAGAQLRERMERGDTLEGALAFVNRALDKRGAVAFDRANPAARNDAVVTTIAASLDLLNEHDRRRVVELSIFSEAKTVPLSAAAALWDLDPFDTEELVQRLDDASLLDFDLKTGVLRMHDVLRAHLQTQIENPASVHAKLVNGQWRDPFALPDTFAWRWIGWHLAQAGEIERLQDLLLDFKWVAAKLDATDVHSLASEFDLVGQVEPFMTVRDALRLSAFSIDRDENQLGVQLCGRLESGQSPALDRLLDAARRYGAAPHLRLVFPTLSHPGGALVALLKGHGASIEAMDVSRDGSRAVTGAVDWTIRIWDLQTWLSVRVLEGHAGTVHSVAFTPDGRQVLSASEDRSLRIWDAETGDCLHVLHGHREAVRGAAVAPDGRSAASLSEDGSVRVWDLERRQSERLFDGAFHQLRGIAYIGDGSRIVFGAGDGTARVIDVTTKQEVARIAGQRAIVTAVASSRDGRWLLAGADDGSVKLWDLTSGQLLRTFAGHTKGVGCVLFGERGNWAASGGSDRLLRIWDLQTGAELNSMEGHAGSIRAIGALGADRLLSASADRTVCCWRLQSARPSSRPQVQEGAISMMAVSAKGNRVVAGSAGLTVEVWDGKTGANIRSLTGHRQAVQALRLTADGSVALTASRDRTLRVWDTGTGQEIHVLKGHLDSIAGAVMTPAGDKAVSLSLDRTLRLWDLRQGSLVRVLITEGSERTAEHLRFRTYELGETVPLQIDSTDLAVPRGARIAISPDGSRAIFADGGTVGIWHLDSGRVVPTVIEDFQTEELAIDGDRAVVGSLFGTVCVIDARDGRFRVLDGRRDTAAGGKVLDIVVDAAGGRATTATGDGSVTAWDLDSGVRIVAVRGEYDAAEAVAIAPNGRLAYVVRGDTIAVSSLVARDPPKKLSFDHRITAIAVTPDGLNAALGDESGRVHFLELDRG